MKCDRCEKVIHGFTMSRMNTEHICDECETKERTHPRYQEAHDVELSEVLKGNYNYPGLFSGQKWPFGWNKEEKTSDGEKSEGVSGL